MIINIPLTKEKGEFLLMDWNPVTYVFLLSYKQTTAALKIKKAIYWANYSVFLKIESHICTSEDDKETLVKERITII